jgi:hypothetical protein
MNRRSSQKYTITWNKYHIQVFNEAPSTDWFPSGIFCCCRWRYQLRMWPVSMTKQLFAKLDTTSLAKLDSGCRICHLVAAPLEVRTHTGKLTPLTISSCNHFQQSKWKSRLKCHTNEIWVFPYTRVNCHVLVRISYGWSTFEPFSCHKQCLKRAGIPYQNFFLFLNFILALINIYWWAG